MRLAEKSCWRRRLEEERFMFGRSERNAVAWVLLCSQCLQPLFCEGLSSALLLPPGNSARAKPQDLPERKDGGLYDANAASRYRRWRRRQRR